MRLLIRYRLVETKVVFEEVSSERAWLPGMYGLLKTVFTVFRVVLSPQSCEWGPTL